MSKKANYTEKAKKMLARGKEFGGENVPAKQAEFAKAYAKLSRTADSCNKWITALQAENADPVVIQPFLDRAVELAVATPVAQAAMTDATHEEHEGESTPEATPEADPTPNPENGEDE